MSDIGDMLAETTARLARENTDATALARAADEAGLLRPFSQSAGELVWDDVAGLVQALGANSPVTFIADQIAGDFIATQHGVPGSGQLCLTGQTLSLSAAGTISGSARYSCGFDGDAHLLAAASGPDGRLKLARLPLDQGKHVQLDAPAEDRRVEINFDAARPSHLVDLPPEAGNPCLLAGSLVRALLIAGAVSKSLDLTVEHCKTRKQFGRPLMALQAIQQQVAQLASEVAAAAAVSGLAARHFGTADAAVLVAAARVRTARAASIAIDAAHQCHGAIGFTEEYPLHRFTRAMMSWRREFGSERFWAQEIGRTLASLEGRAAFWERAVVVAGERQAA